MTRLTRLSWVMAVAAWVACSSGGTSQAPGDASPAAAADTGTAGPGDQAPAGLDAAVAEGGTASEAGASPDLAAPAGGASIDASVPADAGAPAALAIDMTAFLFGPTPATCESARPALLTVSNSGGSPSGVLLVALEGPYPDRFRVEKESCAGRSLAPAATCLVEVRFVAKQVMDQPVTAQLVVTGAAGERAFTALSGEAKAEPFDVFPLMAGFLDFDIVNVGTTSPVLEDVWTNNTDFPATPSAPAWVGPDAADFALVIDTCTGKTIAPRTTCRIGVQMKPSVPGQRTASLSIGATGACGYSFGDTLQLFGAGE